MIILAIESSCDDTCVAILKDKEISFTGRRKFTNVVFK